MEALKGHEENLFKKLYVRIEDCPEWSRETLYQIRQEQLTKPVNSENPIETISSNEEVEFGLVRKLFNRLKKQNR